MKIKGIIQSRLNAANKDLGKCLFMKMEIFYAFDKVKHSFIFEKNKKEIVESIENSSEYISLLKSKIPKEIANGELLFLSLEIDFVEKNCDEYQAIIKTDKGNLTYCNSINF